MRWFPAAACSALVAFAASRFIIAVRAEADSKRALHHVANGGCLAEYTLAVEECHPDLTEFRHDPTKRNKHANNDETCVKATAALRKCFAGNPEWFKHVYLRRIDEGLDQDKQPTPAEMDPGTFRWWAGMRRR